ncbi:MAG: sugar O-acyltransferase (sialic acid O-acetyltransferase NeuD family) [Neolewinella sp.]|jgi:sugar O-acyltransferase (sialic acid O-acetyltransferase NeuD family)
MARLAIVGASGHGRVVADAAECAGWGFIAFFDDAWPKLQSNGPWPVVGDMRALHSVANDYDGIVIAIGNNVIRQQKIREIESFCDKLVSVTHPAAIISPHATVGLGSVVLAGAVLNAFSSMGRGAIINTGAVVEHDVSLGECVHISPNATLAGGVMVGSLSWVGAGASLRQLVKIGSAVTVGMGSVVLNDVTSDNTVVGVPAVTIR